MLELEKLYALSDNKSINMLLEVVGDALDDGKYIEVNDLLATIDVTRCSITLLLGFLSITLPFASMLTNREDFFQCVKVNIESRGRDASQLLDNLDAKR